MDSALCVYYRVRGRFTQSKSRAKQQLASNALRRAVSRTLLEKVVYLFAIGLKQWIRQLINRGNQFSYHILSFYLKDMKTANK